MINVTIDGNYKIISPGNFISSQLKLYHSSSTTSIEDKELTRLKLNNRRATSKFLKGTLMILEEPPSHLEQLEKNFCNLDVEVILLLKTFCTATHRKMAELALREYF